jgi:hypothetical protein
MGGTRTRDRHAHVARQSGDKRNAAATAAPQDFIFTLHERAGNQAVQRLLKGGLPLVLLDPRLRQKLRRQGVRREYAERRLKPEELQGLLMVQLPPGSDLSSPESADPKRRSDEFVVASDQFGVTITHPASESQVRVVEKEHRYRPEDWTYETVHWPNETPAIGYNLVKGPGGGVDQVLIATGPGAWVETSEPAPYEGAKETELQDEWEHGGRPLRFGTFDVTVVEMPDNDLVPLPGENIDVEMLLAAGGKLRSPDRRTWRGAITHEEMVMFWGMLIAQAAMAAIPLAGELLEAAMVATEAGEAAGELGEAADFVSDVVGGETPVPEAPAGELPSVAPEIELPVEEPLVAADEAASEGSVSRIASSTKRTTRYYRQRTPTPEYVRGELPGESLESEGAAKDVASASRAQEAASERGAATPGKTTAVSQRELAPGVTARRTEISGWTSIPERDVAVDPELVHEHAEAIGHELRPAGALDQVDEGGFPGKYYASHAEKQQIVVRPDEPVGVSRPMCNDCIRFFQREAAYQGKPVTVSDPQATRVFSPDGSITEYWKGESILRLDAGGSVLALPAVR